jgi:hypothetical protein
MRGAGFCSALAVGAGWAGGALGAASGACAVHARRRKARRLRLVQRNLRERMA